MTRSWNSFVFKMCCSASFVSMAAGLAYPQENARSGKETRRGANYPTRSRTAATIAQNSSTTSDSSVYQGTRLIGAPIRLRDGNQFGLVDDFVVDSGGRIIYVVADASGDLVPVPYSAFSFGRISSGVLTLDIPIEVVNGVPRFTNVGQLSDPIFQNRIVEFYRDEAGVPSISTVRLLPGELQLGSMILGTTIETVDGGAFGTVGDLMIDQNGVIQFATTAFDGSMVPIPFSGLWLDNVGAGFVTVSVPASVLMDLPPLSNVTVLDPAFQAEVNSRFAASSEVRSQGSGQGARQSARTSGGHMNDEPKKRPSRDRVQEEFLRARGDRKSANTKDSRSSGQDASSDASKRRGGDGARRQEEQAADSTRSFRGTQQQRSGANVQAGVQANGEAVIGNDAANVNADETGGTQQPGAGEQNGTQVPRRDGRQSPGHTGAGHTNRRDGRQNQARNSTGVNNTPPGNSAGNPTTQERRSPTPNSTGTNGGVAQPGSGTSPPNKP